MTDKKRPPSLGAALRSHWGHSSRLSQSQNIPVIIEPIASPTDEAHLPPLPSPRVSQLLSLGPATPTRTLTPLVSEYDDQVSELILNAVHRTNSNDIDGTPHAKRTASDTPSFSKKSFGGMLNFSSLSLTRSNDKPVTSPPEEESKSSFFSPSGSRPRSSSSSRPKDEETSGSKIERSSRSRARSSSPFSRRRRPSARDPSPAVEALKLNQSDIESDGEELGSTRNSKFRLGSIRPRRSAFSRSDDESNSDNSDDSDDDDDDIAVDDDDASLGDDGLGDSSIDALTEKNTEKNALLLAAQDQMSIYAADDDTMPDPLGEGVNVIRPEEPMFATPSHAARTNASANIAGGSGSSSARSGAYPGVGVSGSGSSSPARNPKRKKSMRGGDRLELRTGRPTFSKDRCTVVLTHGDPDGFLKTKKAGDDAGSTVTGASDETAVVREGKRYVVASDLSVESGYAVEWCVGTVLRDGDTMILVSVQETDSKLDPTDGTGTDRVSKLRNQQERQALAYLLGRQVTSLLQRTKLHVTVICQALHAKNSRKMLLDLIDYVEPTMVIVGSRGLGQLKGILLGSTSHFLIQKSTVPVMVARRRLKRPAKRTAHLTAATSQHRSLSQAVIDKAGPGKVDQDVEHMREEIQREENEELKEMEEQRGREGVSIAGLHGH